MTNRDVEREIEANEERARQHERDGDDGIIDSVEDLFEPVIDTIQRGDADDVDNVEERVRENDAEQRPG